MIDANLTGSRIRNECIKKGITVKEIQDALNIGAFQSVYDWFSGKSLPSLENFYELSKLLNVTMEELILEKGFIYWLSDSYISNIGIFVEYQKHPKGYFRKYCS